MAIHRSSQETKLESFFIDSLRNYDYDSKLEAVLMKNQCTRRHTQKIASDAYIVIIASQSDVSQRGLIFCCSPLFSGHPDSISQTVRSISEVLVLGLVRKTDSNISLIAPPINFTGSQK